jgi:hypothetical protein
MLKLHITIFSRTQPSEWLRGQVIPVQMVTCRRQGNDPVRDAKIWRSPFVRRNQLINTAYKLDKRNSRYSKVNCDQETDIAVTEVDKRSCFQTEDNAVPYTDY